MKRFVQFIAGAICPDCKSKDTIALNPSNDEIYCVKCNFVEKRPEGNDLKKNCLLYTSPSPRDVEESRMPSSA